MSECRIYNTLNGKRHGFRLPADDTNAKTWCDAFLEGEYEICKGLAPYGKNEVYGTYNRTDLMLRNATNGDKTFITLLTKPNVDGNQIKTALKGKTFNGVKVDEVIIIGQHQIDTGLTAPNNPQRDIMTLSIQLSLIITLAVLLVTVSSYVFNLNSRIKILENERDEFFKRFENRFEKLENSVKKFNEILHKLDKEILRIKVLNSDDDGQISLFPQRIYMAKDFTEIDNKIYIAFLELLKDKSLIDIKTIAKKAKIKSGNVYYRLRNIEKIKQKIERKSK